MTALEDFENTLKEVVNAKRLSASKMNRLTEIAMKSLMDDTKLVAILYRTHKALPSSAKVSSLYAFDALARAARVLVNKRGSTGDIKSEIGNATTFLLKIEGVLDGLFQDMVSLNSSEAKEKTKKVLEIWVKSNTFPSAVLTRLRDILSDIRKGAYQIQHMWPLSISSACVILPIVAGALASNEMRVSTETPFGSSETVVNPIPPPHPQTATKVPAMITTAAPHSSTAAPDVQATLLALLGQAAQITGQGQPPIQTPPNTNAQLQQNQLALLQQLALTAKLASGSPTPPSGQTPPPPTDGLPSSAAIPAPEPSHSRPPQTGGSRSTPGPRSNYPDQPRDRHGFPDDRHPHGSVRGGFRGRGRGRRDDHPNRDRFRHRDRDWDPPLRPRHSRSRSPRRGEEWRNIRPHSPLRHDGEVHQAELPTPTSTHGKDEFGRDIRVSSNSPSTSTSVEDTQAHAPMETSVDPTPGAPPDYHIPVSEQLPLVAASTSAQSTETDTPRSASQQQPGLDQFDISTFDATAPSSWEALGNMWQASRGYPPSQEELMHLVMAGSMAAAGMVNGTQGGQWQQGDWEDHRLRNGGRPGRGNYVGGGGGNGNGNGTDHSEHAAVLNGDEPNQSIADENTSTGRMQRVGDKWKFVRDPS